METITEINISKLKKDIKVMSEKQKELKNQRKTVHFKGKRFMSPSQATYEHQRNRRSLRLMYAAYGLARGINFSEIENHYPEENHPLCEFQDKIDKILYDYISEEN